MNQCMKITLLVKETASVKMTEKLQKEAQKLKIEGVIRHPQENVLFVVVCGLAERVENFLDFLYKERALQAFEQVAIEPFLKDRDYRGIFRAIK